MKQFKSFFLLILFCLAIVPISSAQLIDSTQTEKLNASRQAFSDHLPQPTGYVNDYENIYTNDQEKILDTLISGFEKTHGIEIAIVTFDTTMTTEEGLDELTLKIANAWGVGQKEKNNGIVIGICSGCRKIRIENGYGIEKMISDSETKRIIDNSFIPGFRSGQYFRGTLEGLQALMKILIERSHKKVDVKF